MGRKCLDAELRALAWRRCQAASTEAPEMRGFLGDRRAPIICGLNIWFVWCLRVLVEISRRSSMEPLDTSPRSDCHERYVPETHPAASVCGILLRSALDAGRGGRSVSNNIS